MSLHAMIDIEALGLRPGSVVIELGCVLFDLETGKTGETFHRKIQPDANLMVDLDTLAWHERHGTWPSPSEDAVPLARALRDFNVWVHGAGTIESFWSWGSTYDFPLLVEAYRMVCLNMPWDYWQLCCARSVWRSAFGNQRADSRPHEALADAKAACRDLMTALVALADGKQEQDPSVFYRAGLRDLLSASVLALTSRCGLAGLTTVGACEALRCGASTVHHAFGRLVEAGLVSAPARDMKPGRPNRYMITPAGRAVLSQEALSLPVSEIQAPLALL